MSAHSSPDLVHASHVRLAYRAMLGREATPDEVRVQLAGLRTTAELLQILQESEEFTGTAHVLIDAKRGPTRVNVWDPAYAAWTHKPGTVSADGTAVVGKEGWLFVQDGLDANVGQHTGTAAMGASWAADWSELLAFRQREAERTNITTAHVVIPDKLAVQGEFFPTPLRPKGLRPAERLTQELQLPLVYPLEALREARAGGEVHLRTDSHFTLRGNDVIHHAVAEALGVEPVPASAIAEPTGYVASGDQGYLFDPQIVEIIHSAMSFGTAEVVEDNRDAVAAMGRFVGSRRVYRSASAPDQRTAILFGDSYGFADIGNDGLAWFLAQIFREVHFVWAPFGWDADYAEQVGATVVVSQIAERLLGSVPAPSIDVVDLVARAVAPTPETELDAYAS